MANVSNLLDALRARFDISSDSELARRLGLSASDICKARTAARLTPRLIVHVHERLGVPVKEIRDLAA